MVKICGVRSPVDARAAIEAGADAIGLNFCPTSPRFVTDSQARDIVSAVSAAEVTAVGVFVNSSADDVLSKVRDVALDMVQLHGDEPPELIGWLGEIPVIRAFRCRDSGLGPVGQYLEQCRRLGADPAAVLLDAYRPGTYGGTGDVLDWRLLGEQRDVLRQGATILAGGLNDANVAEAIRLARPDAVDTAGGVERSPGEKDAESMRRFVDAARAAFAQGSTPPDA